MTRHKAMEALSRQTTDVAAIQMYYDDTGSGEPVYSWKLEHGKPCFCCTNSSSSTQISGIISRYARTWKDHHDNISLGNSPACRNGECDSIVKTNEIVVLQNNVPCFKKQVIKKAGHFPHMPGQQCDEVNRVILEFLNANAISQSV